MQDKKNGLKSHCKKWLKKFWPSFCNTFLPFFIGVMVVISVNSLRIVQTEWNDVIYSFDILQKFGIIEKPNINIEGEMHMSNLPSGCYYENLLSLEHQFSIRGKESYFIYTISISNKSKRQAAFDVIATLDFGSNEIFNIQEFRFQRALGEIPDQIVYTQNPDGSLNYRNIKDPLQNCIEIGPFRGPNLTRVVFDRLPPKSRYEIYIIADRKEQEAATDVSYEVVYNWDRGGNDYKIEDIKGTIGEIQIKGNSVLREVTILIFLLSLGILILMRRIRHHFSNTSLGKENKSEGADEESVPRKKRK